MTPPPRRLLSLSTIFPSDANPQFGTFIARLLEALADRGDWEVTVIAPVGAPPLAIGRYGDRVRAATAGRVGKVEVLRPRFAIVPGIGARFNAASIVRAVLPLARRLHANRPFDMVDAQFFFPDGPAAQMIAAELGLPFSITARGSDIHYWTTRPWARRAIMQAADRAANLVAVSGALARDMAAAGMDRSRIAVITTGLDRTRFQVRDRADCRAALGLPVPPDARLLAGVGALIALKGHDLSIRALAMLPGVHLAIAGGGPERARLGALARELGVADRVHLLGQIGHDALPRLLSAADVMVLPSEREGLANAWVEALACGTPLVITDVGGAREVLIGPDAGELVARDPAAIAAGVRAVIGRDIAPHAVAAIAARFSWDASAANLARAYSTILD